MKPQVKHHYDISERYRPSLAPLRVVAAIPLFVLLGRRTRAPSCSGPVDQDRTWVGRAFRAARLRAVQTKFIQGPAAAGACLVTAPSADSEISKAGTHWICTGLDEEMAAFRDAGSEQPFWYVFADAAHRKAR